MTYEEEQRQLTEEYNRLKIEYGTLSEYFKNNTHKKTKPFASMRG
jgi:hypothetical protein